MNEQIKSAISALNKKYGKDAVAPASQFKSITIERIPTGSFSLDLETGGGFPRGRVIELYGEEGSGKSTIALKTIALCQVRGEECVYVDNEGTFDKVWATKCGVDLDRLLLVQKETAEQNLNIADALIRSGGCNLLVLDSVASLMPQYEEEVSFEDTEKLGDRALMMNRFCRKTSSALNLREGDVPNSCCVLLINQTRMMIGKYGDPTTTPGGRGIGFTASLRVYLRRKDWIMEGVDDKARAIGQTTYFKTTKNKTYPGQRFGVFDIYNVDTSLKNMKAGDIDMTKEIIAYGIFYDLIKQSGKFYTVDGGKSFIQGKDELLVYYKEKPEEFEKLNKAIMEIAIIR